MTTLLNRCSFENGFAVIRLQRISRKSRSFSSSLILKAKENDENAPASHETKSNKENSTGNVPKSTLSGSRLKTVLAGMKVAPSPVLGINIPARPAEPSGPISRPKGVPVVEPELIKAVQSVSEAVPSSEKLRVKSELLDKLTEHAAKTEAAKKAATSDLGAILTRMKVEKTQPKVDQSMTSTVLSDESLEIAQKPISAMFEEQMLGRAAERPQRVQRQQRQSFSAPAERVDLFGSKPLGIFSQVENWNTSDSVSLKTWPKLERRELLRMQDRAPRNAWEEMIRWTRDGKLWTFPINNEQGWEHEEDVDFSEHVFLDYLIQDFPQRGPIKQFMDIVVNALSRNPWITVGEKWEHVDWFRTYFKQNQSILIETIGVEYSTFEENIPEKPDSPIFSCQPDVHQVSPCKHF